MEDNIINKVGFGRFQIIIYITIAVLAITEGVSLIYKAQFMIYTITIPILKDELGIYGNLLAV